MLNVSKVGNVKFEKCKIIKHRHRRFCLDFARNSEGTEPLQ